MTKVLSEMMSMMKEEKRVKAEEERIRLKVEAAAKEQQSLDYDPVTDMSIRDEGIKSVDEILAKYKK